jgi:hypothetical protein
MLYSYNGFIYSIYICIYHEILQHIFHGLQSICCFTMDPLVVKSCMWAYAMCESVVQGVMVQK